MWEKVVIGVRVVEGLDDVIGNAAVVETMIADLMLAFVGGGTAELLAVGMGFAVRWDGGQGGEGVSVLFIVVDSVIHDSLWW